MDVAGGVLVGLGVNLLHGRGLVSARRNERGVDDVEREPAGEVRLVTLEGLHDLVAESFKRDEADFVSLNLEPTKVSRPMTIETTL